ncbi:BQ2448_4560 [Microbotryum intermedium]|uniref:BQ2448_4560 protein n=1 Tax=Microbotryum intermedium TaxID=269621 RepID=A0A238FLB2_9BASI|nr:BQ2448_4560 [Microbotryum intermedium]
MHFLRLFRRFLGTIIIAGFFWGASCFLCTIWCFFRLPEPKGRMSARRFKTTSVDARAHGGSDEKHYEPMGCVH